MKYTPILTVILFQFGALRITLVGTDKNFYANFLRERAD